jgi:2-keto-3-deoxy-L-rhamnonate aldolase RhmA
MTYGWMQILHAAVAEIMGQAGYDWIAFDLEHGSIAVHQNGNGSSTRSIR